MALGALIIKARLGLTDEELVEQIKENPYLQFFIGLEAFQFSAPFDPSMTVYFRKRLPEAVVNGCNERIVRHGLIVIRSSGSQGPGDDNGSAGGGSTNPAAQPKPSSQKLESGFTLDSMAGVPASGVNPPAPPPRPGYAGVGRAPQAIGSSAGVARGGQARFPGLRTTSTRQTMPKSHWAAPELASLLDGSSAGELIPELARRGLQQLIELEVSDVLGADRHERSEERLGYRNGYRPRTLTTQVGRAA
jgi:hypothetical protein